MVRSGDYYLFETDSEEEEEDDEKKDDDSPKKSAFQVRFKLRFNLSVVSSVTMIPNFACLIVLLNNLPQDFSYT